ncbi:MAG: DEAD/DEAH box helicase, partial [Planctomycetota bacterium]
MDSAPETDPTATEADDLSSPHAEEAGTPQEDAPPEVPTGPRFEDLGLAPEILKVLAEVGYEAPSPIQAAVVPHLLAGRDVVGQAQTGTGKTGAFAWPLLQQIDLVTAAPQVLVLTPTRELAIQVAEAFQRYAAHLKNFHVLPIYGGQSYSLQLRPLKRGVHVVVGTPGRVMDHMRRGS